MKRPSPQELLPGLFPDALNGVVVHVPQVAIDLQEHLFALQGRRRMATEEWQHFAHNKCVADLQRTVSIGYKSQVINKSGCLGITCRILCKDHNLFCLVHIVWISEKPQIEIGMSKVARLSGKEIGAYLHAASHGI